MGEQDRKSMPPPRVPGLSLPSFRELEKSIYSHTHREGSLTTAHGMDGIEEESDESSPPPSSPTDTSQNPYSSFPIRGWNIPPDPSQNAFRESGIIYRDPPVVQGLYYQPEQAQTVHRGRTKRRKTHPHFKQGQSLSHDRTERRFMPSMYRIESHIPVASPTAHTQQTLSPTLTPPHCQPSPSSASWTPESTPTHPPRPALADRIPHEPPRPKHRDPADDNDPPVPNPRTQRRRIGVIFQNVAAHTAKCDVCNMRNKNGMSRCQNCGWQICRKCLGDRNADRTHASFGAIHVPEGEIQVPAGQLSRAVEPTEAVRAAQTLLNLGVGGSPVPSAAGGARDNQRRQVAQPRVRGNQKEHGDTLSAGSGVLLSSSVGEGSDEDDIPIGEDGLPLGYVITRRNPSRAARPSKLAE
ncbi:hypothetical protein N7535_001972 [Penicillium sp. DV-2018c]|nr:hypothetical protein N7535_001972 [Penicillium sp. DV-2018c]